MGLVFSGGGSSGVSHIGVLKALEENHIPIDYITGTSMGALVGALYASGYSPEEIEELFVSDQFKKWAEGELDEKYVYYLREKDEDPSMFKLKIELDTVLETTLPTNLTSPVAVDYGLMRYFAPATAKADNDFDSLFIPYRCVASDIVSKKAVIMDKGSLATAVRASMAYPFYLTPVPYQGKLLFDGGLYNNFPSDVMYDEFFPDYIIGSNVSSNFEPPDEDNLVSQIKAIIADNSEYSIECDNAILIQPESSEFSLFDFDNNQKLIQIGYEATMKQIESIKAQVERRSNRMELVEKRNRYRKSLPPLIFEDVEISGLTPGQNKYIRKSLRFKGETATAEDLKPEYIKIASDDKIKSIYPQAIYNKNTGKYTLNLRAKKEKDLFVSFGGAFSSRPINEAYLGLQYNILSKTAITLLANSYFGKLHNSVSAGFRFDFPFQLPFYWKTTFTIDGWDYFKSTSTFFEDTKPSFLVQEDNYFKSEFGFPVSYKGKLILSGTAGELTNKYYQTKNFLSTDTTDQTRFRNYTVGLAFERNSHDLKQYASKGSFLSVGGKFVRGAEHTVPGSTSVIKDEFDTILNWFQLKITYDKYFNSKSKVRLGLFGEGVYSVQPFFHNYTASVLSAPAFQPISESKTLFQENFRAHSYFALGVKNVNYLFKNFQLRLEGYLFQPFQEILSDNQNKAYHGTVWQLQQFIISSAAVYNTPLGPIAVNLNYYEGFDEPWSFLFHFGYLIYNKKSLE
ncbi:MAG: patatin-like phospholipase family protein [Flavobacteriales bacterium]|nr:patatin-like phospholipase family protein [Flavobacteriales bacterium]